MSDTATATPAAPAASTPAPAAPSSPPASSPAPSTTSSPAPAAAPAPSSAPKPPTATKSFDDLFGNTDPVELRPAKAAPKEPPVEPAKAPEAAAPKEPAKAAEPSKEPAAPAAPDHEAAKTAPIWESPENPYLQRWKDTHAWGNRLNQINEELSHKIEVLGKKLDGTYDPAKDEPPTPSASDGALHGRIEASINIAREQFGKDKDGIPFIDKIVLAPDGPYARIEAADPAVKARVMASRAPALEALQVVREHLFYEQWGRDPDQIMTNIRKKLTEELRESIRAEELAKLEKRLQLSHTLPTGLGDVTSPQPPTKPAAPTRKSMEQLFPG